jgi:hypothetical protein
MFHRSNLGAFGWSLPCDIDGYVPEASDGPWDFTIDHGTEKTHTEDGELTDYGEWWEEDGFPAWRDEAVEATRKAEQSLTEWQLDSHDDDAKVDGAESDETSQCCVCGNDVSLAADEGGRCIATDHGPDYVCGDCEYIGDEG